MPPGERTHPARALPAAAAAALVTLAGCASSTPVTPDPAHATTELHEAASRQQRRPDPRAMRAPPPPELLDAAGGPLSGEELARAATPLADALAHYAQAPIRPERDDAPPDSEPNESDELAALRAYVEGRALRLAGELQRAETQLRLAARLDPRSPAVWREFAEVQLALGNLPLAISSLRRALERDENDIRALDVLSRLLLDRAEHAEALRLLARLGRADLSAFDAALPYIVPARTGQALANEGYSAAAAESYGIALDLPDRFAHSTNYTNELSALYRLRGEIWREIGDGALRRGAFSEAASAYARAAELPTAQPGQLLARRVYTAMRAGQPADAALLLIDHLAEPGGVEEPSITGLLAYIAANSENPRRLRAALTARLDEPEDSRNLAVRARLARALAAISPDAEATGVLRAQLGLAPADRATLRALIALQARSGAKDAIAAAAALTSAAPAHHALYARSLAVALDGPGATLRSWPVNNPEALDAGARLLRAELLRLSGELEEAEHLLSAQPPIETAPDAHTAGLLAHLLAQQGRFEEAESLAAALNPDDGEAQRLAHGLILMAVGRLDDAVSTVEPLLHTPGARGPVLADRLVMLALMLERDAQTDRAAALAEEAIALDATREEPYSLLIRATAPNAPLASDERLGATLRSLRDALPDSITMGWLRAQEAMRRRLHDAAESELLAMAAREPGRPESMTLLLTLWRAAGTWPAAETWLRESAERWPSDAVFTLALAECLDAQRRTAEAEAVLEAALINAPGDEHLSRALESFLRRNPDSAARADALAERRLARAQRNTDNIVDLIELALRRGSLDAAVRWASEFEPASAPASQPALQRLSLIVINTARAAARGQWTLTEALDLQHAVVEAFPSIDIRVHAAGFELLSLLEVSADQFIRAADLAAEAHPDSAAEIYRAAAALPAQRARSSRDPALDRPSLFARAALIAEHGAQQLGDDAPIALLADWAAYTPTFTTGARDTESLARLIDLTNSAGLTEALVAELTGRLAREARPLSDSEVAGIIATTFDASTREDLAEPLYRLSVRLDPHNVHSNNNLGYRLLNEGRDIEEAAEMIERAYIAARTDPDIGDRSFVTDSLGWARYKRGIIHDETDPTGRVVKEGAVTVLTRAHQMARNERSMADVLPVVADHLGDAHWAAGNREAALVFWNNAASNARQTLERFERRNIDLERLVEELTTVADAAEAKMAAAREDRPPPISRIHAPINRPAAPPPDPEPPAEPGMID